MPTKPSSKRPKPRSASRATTSARKRAATAEQPPGAPTAAAAPAAPKQDTRSYQERFAEYTKNRPKGPQADGSGAVVPAAVPSRLIAGRPEFATDGMGAPLGSAAGAKSTSAPSGAAAPADSKVGSAIVSGTAPDGTPRYAAIVGPPEGSLFSSAMDATAHAAAQNDLEKAAASLPPGTMIEALGNMHGFRVITSGMHKITGNGRTVMEAIKNLGVPEPRDEEKPEELKSATLKQAESTAREQRAAVEASPTAGEPAPARPVGESTPATENKPTAETGAPKGVSRTGKATPSRARGAKRGGK